MKITPMETFAAWHQLEYAVVFADCFFLSFFGPADE
jgi:hypothetical protein